MIYALYVYLALVAVLFIMDVGESNYRWLFKGQPWRWSPRYFLACCWALHKLVVCLAFIPVALVLVWLPLQACKLGVPFFDRLMDLSYLYVIAPLTEHPKYLRRSALPVRR